MAKDLDKTPNNEIIKRTLPLEMNSSVENVPESVLDNPISNGLVDPKTSSHAWDEK
jgi:hypothetical protein